MSPSAQTSPLLFRDRFHQQLVELKKAALKHLIELLSYDFQVTPVMAGEIEFYIPDTGPHETDDSILSVINAALDSANISASPAEQERGQRQYEVALLPTDDIPLLADTLWRLPRVIEETIRSLGGTVDFRAKPFANDYGSGLHLHIHIEDKSGQNLFSREKEGSYSREILWSLDGLLELTPETMLLFAHEPEAYQRFTKKRQNSPTHLCWGPNNRTAALRLPNKDLASKHIEHRISGADADPQLAIIGILAGICYGFRERQFPSEAIHGIASDAQYDLPPLPSYTEALDAFQSSENLPFYLGKELYSELLRRFMLPTAY